MPVRSAYYASSEINFAQEGTLRHELPYSGEFQRERADLLNYMKAVCRDAPSL